MHIQEDLHLEGTSILSPRGTIQVVDPSPLNWLYTLFNTMEEAVRADPLGRIIPSLAAGFAWIDDTTLEVKLRQGVQYHDNEPFTAEIVRENFSQMQKWISPHPPGTWLMFPGGTTLEVIDNYTVRFHFPGPEGLALGKMRAFHFANSLFWQSLGFGYAKYGTGEGRW